MSNITEENKNIDQEIVKYLEKFGKVEIIKPIKNRQGRLVAKNSYFCSLFYNSSVQDSKFVDFCKTNSVLIQFDAFN